MATRVHVELTERTSAGDEFTHTIRTWVAAPTGTAFDDVADITRHTECADGPKVAEALDAPLVHVGSRFHAVGYQTGWD